MSIIIAQWTVSLNMAIPAAVVEGIVALTTYDQWELNQGRVRLSLSKPVDIDAYLCWVVVVSFSAIFVGFVYSLLFLCVL